MSNLSSCTCITKTKRHHHGVVCASCNNQKINPLLVIGDITAYRVWKFNPVQGFNISRNSGMNKWSDFNDVVPPGFGEQQDSMKPWSGKAECKIYNHSAPNPYCSCGYYSIKEFGTPFGGGFGHDSTPLLKSYTNELAKNLDLYTEDEKKELAKLLFYSPVAKTLELKDFNLLAEVSLTGITIECELGYRSEYVEPKKFYLLLELDTLYSLVSYLGNIIGKDDAEKFYVTYQWVIYLDNYFTNVLRLYGYDFELRFNTEGYDDDGFEYLTGDQSKNSNYLPLRDHPFIYTKFRYISEVIEATNRIMRHQLPSLEEMRLEFEKVSDDNLVQLDRQRNRWNYMMARRSRQGNLLTISGRYRKENLDSFFPDYIKSLLAFAHFNVMLGERSLQRNHLLAYPNLAQKFGFRYHTYLENRYPAELMATERTKTEEHPMHFFKGLYPYFKEYLYKNNHISDSEYNDLFGVQ